MLLVLLVGNVSICAAAEEVPRFDVGRTCRAESENAPTTRQACMADEQTAQQQLQSEWGQFPLADRRRCVGTETDIAGVRSYVELLTCLEMARDARALPKR